MKLLMLNGGPRGLGTFNRAFHLGCEFVRRGHRVSLFTSSTKKTHFIIRKEWVDGVEVIETPWPILNLDVWELGFGLVENWVRALHTIKERFDIIHTFQHVPSSMLPGFLGKYLRHAIWVSDWDDLWTEGGIFDRPRHFPLFYNGLFLFEHRMRRFADAVTTVSQELYERAVALGIPKVSLLKLWNGVDLKRFFPCPKREARKTLNLPQELPILEFVGDCQTDMDLLLDSFTRVRQKYPEVRLLIVGSYRKHWEGVMKKLELEGHLIHRGLCPYDQIPLYMSAADILLLPMKEKLFNKARFPIKFGEYLAVEKPIVMVPIGEIGVIARQNNLGYLTAPLAEDFSEKIIYLLSHPEEGERMGKKQREFALTTLGWDKIANQLEAFYTQLLNR